MNKKPLYFTFINFLIVVVPWSLWKIGTIHWNSDGLQLITIIISVIYIIFMTGGEAILYWIYLSKQNYIAIIKCLIYTIIFDIILLVIAQNINEEAIERVKYSIINQIIGYILGNIRKIITDKENEKDIDEEF